MAGCCLRAAVVYGINDVEVVGKQVVPDTHDSEKIEKKQQRHVADELVNKVDALLPAQPWKPRIHQEIASKLSLDPKDVSAAIGQLMSSRAPLPPARRACLRD